MGNRALRRQQAKLKERTGGAAKSGGAPRVPKSPPSRQGRRPSGGGGGGGILSWRPRLLMDVWTELRKVVWPEREDVVHLTIVVVIVTLMIGAVLGGIDIAFGWLIERTLLT